MLKRFQYYKLAIFLLSLAFFKVGGVDAGTLVAVSSTTCKGPVNNNDYAYGVAIDNSGNIIVAGTSINGANIDQLMIKYNSNFTLISSKTFDGGGSDWVYGVAVDDSDNIIVAGVYHSVYLTAKYNSNLVFISSAIFDGGASDKAAKVAIDKSGNIIVTGCSHNGSSFDYLTIKYDPNLIIISSVTFDGGGHDYAYGLAVDGFGNVIVTGYSNNGLNKDYFTIKYDPNLVVISSVAFDGGRDDEAKGVAVDGFGNIVVTGYSDNGLNKDWFTIKYNSNLVLISSVTLDNGSYDYAYGLAVDGSGNIIVVGNSAIGPGDSYLTVRYDPNLVVRSSATYDSGRWDCAYDVALDDLENIVVTGSSSNASDYDYFTIKYYGNPVVSAITPAFGEPGKTLDVVITGYNFLPDPTVSFTGTAITVNSIVRNSAEKLTANIAIAANATAGKWDVAVVNTDAGTATKSQAFEVKVTTVTTTAITETTIVNSSNTAIDAANGGICSIRPESGEITINVPAGTFGQNVTMTVAAIAVPSSGQSTIKTTNVGVEITNDAGLQPSKAITITVCYRDADISSLEESKLMLARYDNGRWIPIPTTVYADQNKLVGTVAHLSTFAIIQLIPASDLSGARAYPVPFRPALGSLTIDNLTADAEIMIYTIAGELVREIRDVSASGMVSWDGRNDNGSAVASGVYLALIKSCTGKRIIKIAIIK